MFPFLNSYQEGMFVYWKGQILIAFSIFQVMVLNAYMNIDIPFTKRCRQETMMLDQNVLKESSSNYQALTIKARHFSIENQSLNATVRDLQTQISSLRAINQELTKSSPKTVQILIGQLNRQNTNLQNSLFRLTKQNQQLSCDILMKNQLIAENQHQFNEILASYQSKIYDLRVSLQAKEACFTNIEDKIRGNKEEQFYNLPSRANVMYFSQMYETKQLLQKFQAQNLEIQLTVFKQHESIEQTTKRLQKCQALLKDTEKWQNYLNSIETVLTNDNTKNQSNFSKAKIENELSKYQQKYKYTVFPWRNSRKGDLSNQIYELRLLVTKLYRDRWEIREQKKEIDKKIAKREEQIRKLKASCEINEREVLMAKIEVQFYREHFKELAKVPTERKIKFYDLYYPERVPSLEKKTNCREAQIKYWKHWYQYVLSQWLFIQKRMIFKRSKLTRPLLRSNSCQARLDHLETPLLRRPTSPSKDETIVSFINNYNQTNTYLGYTFQDPPTKDKEPNFFQEQEFSIIQKPNKSKDKTRPFAKKQLTIEEM